MRVLCFGTYERLFPRNTTLIAGLRLAGAEVEECHEPLWELTRDKTGTSFTNPLAMLRTALRVLRAYWRLMLRHRHTDYDVMVVGYMGYLDMLLAAALSGIRHRPLVYSPVVSLHETVVTDREMFSARSIPGRLAWRLDQWALRLADLIVLETATYVTYFASEFGIAANRFVTVRLGADETTFSPREKRNDGLFRVFFYGKFTPLQGVPVIIRAAARVQQLNPGIRFEIVGSGQATGEVQRLTSEFGLTNTDFIPWVSYEELPDHIGGADVSLGIFGVSEKTNRGIPVKVFDALAMGMPIITGDTAAARELLVHETNALLCPTGDPESLARAILRLHDEPALLEHIARGATELFNESCTQEKIGRSLYGHFQILCSRGNTSATASRCGSENGR
jgi:glycosyltransferase involved in cell wall biosynthesis